MNGSPLISVVIPCYNRAHTITDALRSVLSQSVSDLEALVIDDGSTDDLAAVIARVRDPRVRYSRRENGGGGAARNTGIEQARGRYIAFLDSDDRFLDGHLARSLQSMHGDERACSYARVVADRGGVSFTKPHRGIRPGEDVSEYLLCARGFIPTSTLVVPAALARRVRYDERLRYGQDTDFAIRLAGAGATFVMQSVAGAVWDDRSGTARVSSGASWKAREEWLERLGGLVTPRARAGDRGWPVAKFHAMEGHWRVAMKLYATALARGCFDPKTATIAITQIVLRPGLYRRFANGLARIGLSP